MNVTSPIATTLPEKARKSPNKITQTECHTPHCNFAIVQCTASDEIGKAIARLKLINFQMC